MTLKGHIIWAIIFAIIVWCIIFFNGCTTKTVFYQIQTPVINYTYSSDGEDRPLTFEEWLDIIGYGEKEDNPPEIEEKQEL